MNRWQRRFLGSTSLSRNLTDFDLEHFFVLNGEERKAVRSLLGPEETYYRVLPREKRRYDPMTSGLEVGIGVIKDAREMPEDEKESRWAFGQDGRPNSTSSQGN